MGGSILPFFSGTDSQIANSIAFWNMVATWIGSVAFSFFAVFFSIYQYRVDKEHRRLKKVEEENRREKQSLELARNCAIRIVPLSYDGKAFHKIGISFQNKLSANVCNVELKIDGDKSLGTDLQVIPGKTWGKCVNAEMIFDSPLFGDRREAMKQIHESDRMKSLSFEYTINDYRFQRIGKVVTRIQKPLLKDRHREN